MQPIQRMKGVVGFFDGSWLTDIVAVRAWAKDNFPRMAFTPKQVVAAAADRPEWDGAFDHPGVYFLQRAGRICYIGRSSGVISRIGEHRRQFRPFDAVTVLCGVPPAATASLEYAYESAWRPPWNVAMTGGSLAGTEELRAALSAMPRDLICNEAEIPGLTEDEANQIADRL